jgi:HEAT repeat protein
LVEYLNAPGNSDDRALAAESLGKIGPPAKEAVPSLLRWATDTNDWVRSRTIRALGNIGADSARVVPALTNALYDGDFNVQQSAVAALGEFGPSARIAVPALAEFLIPQEFDRYADMSSDVSNALKKIDPQAAARAGVK